jgi:formate/nitrite transporter FocA (FNT family)
MFLDVTRAITFFLGILSLYQAAISAFFVPGTHWEDRILMALARLGLSACVCFLSGMLFAWPSRATAHTHPSVISTLPVQMFFWSLGLIVILFIGSWYLATYPCNINISHDCGMRLL